MGIAEPRVVARTSGDDYHHDSMTSILIPRNIPLRTPRKQISPSLGQMVVSCGQCNSREFGVHVRPERDYAHVTTLVCLRCGELLRVDDHGRLGGGINREAHE